MTASSVGHVRSGTRPPCVLVLLGFRRPCTNELTDGTTNGPRPLTEVQAMPPRGDEALPQGRALSDREVRRRAPQLPAGGARPRPYQAVRVPAAAAREAEGAALLRPARDPVPHLLREGDPPGRRHRRQPAACARD